MGSGQTNGSDITKIKGVLTQILIEKKGENVEKETHTFFPLLLKNSKNLSNKDISTLLDAYFRLLKQVPDAVKDKTALYISLGIFESLLTLKINAAQYYDAIIHTLHEYLQVPKKYLELQDRYIRRFIKLNTQQKNTIKILVFNKIQEKEKFTFFKVLEYLFYKKQEPHRLPKSIDELLTFNPYNDEKLKEQYLFFEKGITTQFFKSNTNSVHRAINDFYRVLQQKNQIELFQIFLWSRRQISRIEKENSIGTYIAMPTRTDIKSEIYLICFNFIFISLLNNSRYNVLLTSSETEIVLEPLKKLKYSSNYEGRLEVFLKSYQKVLPAGKRIKFKDMVSLSIEMLLFAKNNKAEWVSLDEQDKIEAILRTNKRELKNRVLTTTGPEILRGKTRIGDIYGNVFKIIYFDTSVNNPSIYVSYFGLEQFLFKISVSQLDNVSAGVFYTETYNRTKHLQILIPLFFEILLYNYTQVSHP
ncbi:MAG: hypothetical protein ABIJ16_00065 [Bacteroidota bacterium]